MIFFSTQAYERRASLATAAILYPRNSTKAQSFSGRDRLLAYPLLDQGYCNLLSTLFIWKGWSWGWPLPPLLLPGSLSGREQKFRAALGCFLSTWSSSTQQWPQGPQCAQQQLCSTTQPTAGLAAARELSGKLGNYLGWAEFNWFDHFFLKVDSPDAALCLNFCLNLYAYLCRATNSMSALSICLHTLLPQIKYIPKLWQSYLSSALRLAS